MENNKKIDFNKFIEYKLLKENFPDSIVKADYGFEELSIIVKKDNIYDICKFLHDNKELQYDYLTDLYGVDWYPKAQNEPRFMVAYQLYSITKNKKVRIKAFLHIEDLNIASVESIWATADWLERETYDMFGINFTGHPFMHRIFMPDEFEDFPLRKDYPLEGK